MAVTGIEEVRAELDQGLDVAAADIREVTDMRGPYEGGPRAMLTGGQARLHAGIAG